MEKKQETSDEPDRFIRRVDRVLTEEEVEKLNNGSAAKEGFRRRLTLSTLGDVWLTDTSVERWPNDEPPKFSVDQYNPAFRSKLKKFKGFERELASVVDNYFDLLYCSQHVRQRSEKIRKVYCSHALNHIRKARRRILTNNAKLRKLKEDKINGTKGRTEDADDDQFRDQGLTRPRILILVPFRDSALRVVKILMNLSCGSKKDSFRNAKNDQDEEDVGDKVVKTAVMKKKRFLEEYGGDDEEPKKKKRKTSLRNRAPEYDEIFCGNVDDCFRIGLSFGKRTLRLYSKFYHSDILIASPLGLRMAIGTDSQNDYDYDFLSSIELMILDQADIFLMQNWNHVQYIFQHIHKQPREARDVDFSRVCHQSINGWMQYYRQTLVFSSVKTAEMNALFSKYCRNFAGLASGPVEDLDSGSLSRIVIQIPHAFQRFSTDDLATEGDRRFEFFVNKVLPQYADRSMVGVLVYIPSYYDFVRLRNYCKNNHVSHVQVCEYTKDSKVDTGRGLFYNGTKQFMLYTERFHFFNRRRIRGVKHLVFYQLPTYPNFYSELCNNMLEMDDDDDDDGKDDHVERTCGVIFCKYDALLLCGAVGKPRAAGMLNSEKDVHMLVTGE